MNRKKKNIYKSLGLSFLIIFLSVVFVNAWNAPTTTPPDGNAPAPINVSSSAQSKNGPLALNFLGVRDDARIDGKIHLDGDTSATNYISGETPGIRLRTTDEIGFYTGGFNRRMTIKGDGQIGIGTTDPGSKLDVRGDVSTSGGFFYNSDEKLKKDIEKLRSEDLMNLEAISYTDKNSEEEMIGFIAQDVEEFYPELVKEKKGIKTLDYGRLTAPLLELVKSQNKQIEAQEEEIERLSQEVEDIKESLKDN